MCLKNIFLDPKSIYRGESITNSVTGSVYVDLLPVLPHNFTMFSEELFYFEPAKIWSMQTS